MPHRECCEFEEKHLRGAPRRRRDRDDFHLQNQAQVSISEVPFPGSCFRGFPAPPDRHCPGFLRSGAPGPACRTQTGRPGSRMCRDFAVRRGKNGVPPAKRTTCPPSGPRKHGRTGARDCDSSIVSAFSRPGASNPREWGRILAARGFDSASCVSEYAVNHRPGHGPGRRIPVSVANSQNGISGYAVNYRPDRHP